jgi:hypothetical protein
MLSDESFEGLDLGRRQAVVCAAVCTNEMDVTGVFGAVVFDTSLEVSMGQHADVLEQGQGPVDRGCVHPWDALLDALGDLADADVTVQLQDLCHYGAPLGGHAESAPAQRIEDVVDYHGRAHAGTLAGATSCNSTDRIRIR